MYIADWLGKHVVRVSKEGSQEDLGLWQYEPDLQQDGPRGVSFNSNGEMYVYNHRQIFLVGQDLEVVPLNDINGSPLGDVAFDLENNLFYTDRGGGTINRWSAEEGSVVISSGLVSPEYLVFGLDGTLYVSLQNQDRVIQVNPESGEVLEFISGYVGPDPIFLAVDSEGDIWVRALRGLLQFGPDGTPKPFFVDGEEYIGGINSGNWVTSGGIAFDDEGALWAASYNSLVMRLQLNDPGIVNDEFSRVVLSAGFQAYDLAISPEGIVYASDNNTHSIIKFAQGEEPVTIMQDDLISNAALAVNQSGDLFMGLSDGRIVRLEPEGVITTFANFQPFQMVFGIDGALYAVEWQEGGDAKIVRITAQNQSEVWLTEVDGTLLGIGEINLALAEDEGLYIFKQRGRDLYFVDYDAQGYLIANLLSLGVAGESGGPVAFGASPLTGNMYFIPHGPYRFYELDPSGNAHEIFRGIVGDPAAIVVSPDGQWIFVSESGAIDKLPIGSP